MTASSATSASTPKTGAQASTRRTAGANDSRRTTVIVIGAVFILIAAAITLLGILAMGAVTGTEFSPNTFTTRSFEYREIPLIHFQITPVSRTIQTVPLESLLQSEKLLPPGTSEAADVWHLVSMSRAAVTVLRGDAELLVKYLGEPMGGTNSSWLDWTKKHPELAKEFWPIVARVARRNEYLLAPDLFEIVQSAKTAEELKQTLRQHLTTQYHRWAKVEHELGHQAKALELADEALFYAKDPPSPQPDLTKDRRQKAAE